MLHHERVFFCQSAKSLMRYGMTIVSCKINTEFTHCEKKFDDARVIGGSTREVLLH